MKKVEGGHVMDGISVKKRTRMESALWRLDGQLKREFPRGRPEGEGLEGRIGHRFNRIEHEIHVLRNKLRML